MNEQKIDQFKEKPLMDEHEIDQFIITKSNFFPTDKIIYIKEKLSTISKSKSMLLYSINFKDPTTVLIISVFLGSLGIDRFILGEVGLGILKLLTFGGCGIWSIIDLCTINKKTQDYNFNELMKYI